MGNAVNELESGKTTAWVPVVRTAEESESASPLDEDYEWLAPPRVCLEVRTDGTLVIGEPDPDEDARLSDLLLVDSCGEA